MKKILLVVLGSLAFLIVVVAVGPLLVDWNRFKPQVAQAVRDATGFELRIDGELRVMLLPAINVTADGVRLLNPAGFETPHLVSIKTVHGRVRLWPLLWRRVDVERIVVEHLDLALEVNENGQANWTSKPVAESPGAPERAYKETSVLSVRDLRLGELRLTDSALSFQNTLNDQRLVAREWEMTTSPAGLADPFELKASLMLNDERVSLEASMEPLRAVLEHGPGRFGLHVETTHIEAQLDTELQTTPILGLDGVGSIDVSSAGALAAWLDIPLDSDPGPLALRARFSSDGANVALDELSIEGDYLDARGSASIDLKDDVTRFVAELQGGLVDVDRYLPRALLDGRAEADGHSLLDALRASSETPLDPGPLRQLIAELSIDVADIRLAGYTLGPIRLQGSAKDGYVDVELGEVGLYDGVLSGVVRLDAAADSLALEASFDASDIDAGAVAAVAAQQAPRVTGTASGHIDVQTQGRTLRALAANMRGLLKTELASDDGVGGVGQLSQLSLALQRPAGADARLSLSGGAVYGGEYLVFDVTSDPLRNALAGEPVAVEAEIASELFETSYRGRVLQAPVPSLDGVFDAKLPSVGRLALWMGRPLASNQPDPGAMEAHAVFQSNGESGTVEEATLSADGLSLRGSGNFETSGGRVRFKLDVEGGMLDLDRYLPARAKPDSKPIDFGDSENVLVGFSDEPLDMSLLNAYVGQVDVALQGLRVSGVQTGSVVFVGQLDNGVLEARLDELVLPEFTINAVLRADGSGAELRAGASAQLDGIKTTRLDTMLGSNGRAMGDASAVLELSARGNSPRRLLAGASGDLVLSLPRVQIAKGPFASMDDISATAELPGIEARSRIKASAKLEARETGATYPFELQAEAGPLAKLITAKELPLEVLAKIGENDISVNGNVSGLDATPRSELDIRFAGPRLSGLGADTGGRLADVGPVYIAAILRTQPGEYRVNGLTAEVGWSDLAGDIVAVFDGERPRVSAVLRSNLIDLWELVPYVPSEVTAQPVELLASTYLVPDKPLPLSDLQNVDADLRIAVAKLRTDIDTRIDDIEARIKLAEARLEVAPATGGFAGGRTSFRLLLDAGRQPARFNVQVTESQMLLGTFVPVLKSSGDSVGRADVDLELSGVGDTPRAIAASLDGYLGIVGEGGAVDSTLLRLLVVGVGEILTPFFNRQGNTNLDCFVAGLGFEDGIGTVNTFLVDMPSLSIEGSGTLDMSDETLDLRFRSESKHPSLASLAGPFDVTGTLTSPRVRTSTVGTVLSAATRPLATARGILGRVLPGGQDPCETAIRALHSWHRADEPAEPSSDAPEGEAVDAIESAPDRTRPSRRN